MFANMKLLMRKLMHLRYLQILHEMGFIAPYEKVTGMSLEKALYPGTLVKL